jgi:sugar/nucleoside kinase (ribokinase family)
MFVIIGTTTADLLILSQASLANPGADGFTAGNVVFTDTPARLLMGGNGGNSAYVLAGLGVPTALCSSVGQDKLGDALVDWLRARGINLDGLTRSDTHATSTSVILMMDAANQVVFHHPGSTTQIRFEAMPETLFAGADVLLASSFSLMPKMRAGGFAQALTKTHQCGGVTALDIGPAIGNPVTPDDILPLLPALDYLIANSYELTRLTGVDDWEVAATHLLEAGVQHLVIKRGEDGASMRWGEAQVDIPGFKVKANVSVGAGDAFNVGFLYGVEQKWPPDQAIRFGNAVAALLVTGEQGVLDSPTLGQVETFLAANG